MNTAEAQPQRTASVAVKVELSGFLDHIPYLKLENSMCLRLKTAMRKIPIEKGSQEARKLDGTIPKHDLLVSAPFSVSALTPLSCRLNTVIMQVLLRGD